MKISKKGFKNLIIYILLRILLGFINLLPLKEAYLFAGALAKSAYYIFPSDRRTALSNLRIAFENRSRPDLKSIYKQSLKNIGYSAVDVLRFKKFNRGEIMKMVEVVGLENFDKAYNRGRGIVAVTGHISNFELIAAWFGQAGYKTAAVGRQLYDIRLNRMLIKNRERMNVLCIDSEAPVSRFMRTLRQGYAIGVLVDQDSSRYRGEFVEFFGKPAYTPIGPILLARMAKAAVVPIVIIRKKPMRYSMIIFPELTFDYESDRNEDVKRVLTKVTEILENTIKENPEHWVWMHKRWKTKPKDIEEYIK